MTDPFRNVVGSVDDPVEQWPYEALVSTIERGTLKDWRPILTAISRSPWGVVARQVEDFLSYESPYGVGPLLRRRIERARREAGERERQTAAARVRAMVEASGLSREEFAREIGTSPSRLSTYCTGRVSPSAALFVRMENVSAAGDARGLIDRDRE